MNKFIKLTVLTVAVLSLTNCGNGNKQKGIAPVKDSLQRVEVLTLQREKIAHTLTLSTTLQGYETMNISPSITGKIEQIHVDVGSNVKKGQTLVVMDQNQLNTTKLAFTNLKIEMARMEALHESGSVSQQAYDQMKLQYEQTKESLAFLEKNTFVKADFSGVISARNYEDGELYSGMPILVLTQITMLKALVNIPETYFPIVKEGQKVNLTSDIYPQQAFTAVIETVYPTIDPASHTFQIKLRIANSKQILRPGMFARVTLEMGEIESLLVPYQAVLKLQGSNERYVFLNDNGVAKRISVKLGQRFDDKIEILSSEIKEKDQIITAGQSRLIAGDKLQIQEKTNSNLSSNNK
ncbi:MAG: efflux RND transporter periplasmic adaptor subunit [Bacteroidales bacterium]|jgi:RND family efflux transporter MFP subunit|nr:efflux RND transporter periplasmic adaptor subunit [Bacteroidales bacterium]